jgi:hypothetical protein
MRSACLAPEILKPRRRQLRVPDRMLNVAVTDVSLDRSGIMSLVGQGITAGMPIPSVLRVHAESDIRYTQVWRKRTYRVFRVRSLSPLLDMTTTVTGLLCWRDFKPLEWQLASLHQISIS